jgi:ubiquitin carboxyl-terminal hydrolase 19
MIEFYETNTKILFKSSDQKFLKENTTDDPNSLFEINVELFDKIETSKCHYKVTKFNLEVYLVKKNPLIKWPTVLKSNENFNHINTQTLRTDENQSIKQRINITNSYVSPSSSPPQSPEIIVKSKNGLETKIFPQLVNNRLASKKLYYGLTGLVNLGNTCYMNAAIQLIANATDIRDYFIGMMSKFFNRNILVL